MPEQKERLEIFCKFKGYEIVDYYTDAGISDKQEDEINDLKEENSKLKQTINYFENLFSKLVSFIKKRIVGKEKDDYDINM